MKIQSPQDLRAMDLDELRQLAEDIRQEILSACLKNGGHLGASLGTVELAIALHASFESPREPIVWDVGHQAYAHKLITGRWDRFQTLRTTGGVSGFLSRDESEHDVFGAGHSSTSVSAALAMAWARRDKTDWTVAVIGDGGLTAGVALEALNNVRSLHLGPLAVVLNDNQMSISANVGAIPSILGGGQADEFFNHFGFDYIGPVDGHDLGALIGTLRGIREAYPDRQKPILLHVLTQKGKGYIPAEEHPAAYHGVSPVQSKLPERDQPRKQKTYSEAFGEALCALAEKDPRIVAITAAMPEGTGLLEFSRRFPDRFFDVGIAEPHAVTFAAGLATQGYRPVVAIYSTFLQRGLDAIIHDVALQRLGVTFAIDRAGLVGADGPTHHGAFDIPYLRMIPGMRVASPSTLEDVKELLEEALAQSGPFSIRYPRGSGPVSLPAMLENAVRWHQKAKAPGLILIGAGVFAEKVAKAASALDPSAANISAISVRELKPIPDELLAYLRSNPGAKLLIAEEGAVSGGFGQALAAAMSESSDRVRLLGYGDHFIPHGSVKDLEAGEGLSQEGLLASARKFLGTQP